MKNTTAGLAVAVAMSLGCPRVACAGMPMVTLSDVAEMRLEAISFFLVCFLGSSWVVRWIWNSARHDFPRLPRLTFRRATGIVAVWGLLFVLVLTMISGARELMTPGAWHKQGFTYKLAENDQAAKSAAVLKDMERRHALDRLRAALWTYSRSHSGRFPATSTPPEIPDDIWLVPDPSGMRYVYVEGLVADQGAKVVAYEPGIFGKVRFVLLTSGAIERMPEENLNAALAERGP